jgi:urease accessory protein
VAAGATLEWLPQETIFFESCRARNRIEFEVEPGGRLLAWEIACLGRVRTSERFARGEAFQSLSLNVDGRLRWTERGRLVAGNRALGSNVGLGDHSVFGTALFHPATPAEGARLLEACRAADNDTAGATGLTLLGDLMVGRYLGDSAEDARAVFTGWWAAVRPSLIGRPAVLPRIWNT